MGRGLILGLGWGVLTAVTAGATLSLMYSNDNKAPVAQHDGSQKLSPAAVPTETAPAVGTVETPTQQAEPQASPESIGSEIETVENATAAPAMPEVTTGDRSVEAGAAAPGNAPEVTIAETDAGDLATNADKAEITPPTSDPVQLSENSTMPKVPATEGQPLIEPQIEPQAEAMTAPAMQEGPIAGDPPKVEMTPDTTRPEVETAGLPKATAPDPVENPETDSAMSQETTAPDVPQETRPDVTEGESRFDSARVSVPKMTNLAPNVRTNRLPSIGGPDDVVETVQEPVDAPEQGGLKSYAMAFENPDAKPMFSVILMDDPQHPIGDNVLSKLPFALSFAIDAVRDDAADVAARYRAAGFEVLMLTNLPQGADAADIETAFGAYLRAIPEAIGVLDLGANGFLRGPGAATQIAGIMSESGLGLITPSKGLNSAQKAAMREGVPAALLFRELDAEAEKPATIRRYLDRAAFRAAQEGSVIMLGHTRPDTIEALVTWALEARAASIAIAPVSAILLAR